MAEEAHVFSVFPLDQNLGFQHPSTVALRTFRGLVQFPVRELEATGATAGRFNHRLVISMLEAAQKMIQVVGDLAGRLIHLAGKSARRLVGLNAGVAFDLNWNQFHQQETELLFSSLPRSTTCARGTWAAITCPIRRHINPFSQSP